MAPNYRITHKTGRCRSGSDQTGYITHIVINNHAICNNNPKGRSNWSEYDDKIITCKKCLILKDQLKINL